MNSPEKFDENALPPIEAFNSILRDSGISKADYEHAKNVWSTGEMTTLADYHDCYLKTDVAILADVFTKFRKTTIEKFGLDPLHYLTLPALSFDCLFKNTGASIELITEEDTYKFFEKSIRGGICQSVKRHARAESQRPILYIDANNLYGWAMSQYLPTGNFAIRTEMKTDDEELAF